ncbi:ABC transporter permease [Alloacidobacterium sp.]|uniref:ABC transporter permease n=1 Tax=Alloacidobacterium sp. TaxID=2951999 RepID=UPI002D5BB705|nr:ABC transporter permease [Alloacidobacterium sp.]HYK37326.1 ABC transporter permease [Alloacidobacterium sp.]
MLSDLLYRLRALFRGKEMDAEAEDELRYHLEREAEKYRRSGISSEDASRRARLAFGGTTQVEQECRESRGTKFVEDLLQDLRYAIRSFAKTPGLSLMIVLSLAIGIGANTAIFSVTSTLLLKPLPYPHPDRLAILWLRSPGIGIPQDWPSPGQYHDIVTQNHVFEETALAIGDNFTLTEHTRAIKVDGIEATSSLLPMLGAKAMLGRIFLPEEDEPGRPQTVVLTYGFWQREFAGDPNIVGRSITLDGHPHTVVGVLSPDFRLNHEVIPTVAGIDKPEIFMPPKEEAKNPTNYGSENYNIVGRLKPGVTMQQAQADIDVIAARLREEKHRDRSFTISVVPLMEQVVGNVRTAVLILFGAVGLVLLIACTNVANLLLSRATTRQREIAIRAALGAGRARVIRQLLTESILLSLMGGVAGLGLSALSIFVARRMHPGNIPRLDELGMDFRVLVFTFGVAILTGIVFGLAPALRASHVDLTANLKAGGKGSLSGGLSVRHDKLRGALVIAELAISLPLLVGAGLLVRSFVRLANVPPGFNPKDVVSMDIGAYGPEFKDPATRVQFYQQLAEGIGRLPGVTATGAISALPLTSAVGWGGMHIEGYVPPANEPELQVDVRAATTTYFSTMQIPLIRGRMFAETDTDKMPPVAIIDQKMADRFWPNGDAIGKRIRRSDDSPWTTIVGVVGVVKEYGLDTDTRMVVYYPHTQIRNGTLYVVARTSSDPASTISAIIHVVNTINPGVPVYDVATMEQRVQDSMARQRFAMTMLGGFAGFAMILAAIGIYGVMSFLVTQGTADIAIRVALGARRASILSLVFRQGVGLVLLGIVAGLIGALGFTRLMNSMLFGVKPTDPLTFFSVLALLLFVAVFACLVPAGRAMRIDPMTALRTE